MKLIKCYISAFGKLKDFTYDFSDGVNTIFRDNGWGKSTLATFIKCVFYGISSKKRNIEENDRIKYAPWNYNEKFGGYIVFEKEGHQIKAERYFGKKESDDTLTLTDVKTGKIFSCPDNLGEYIFKIDEDGFTSTLFFTQNDLEIKDGTGLSSKFNTSDPTDTKAFETAVLQLEKKIKE
ncbi:MAG: AAA family ATPase, partial [Clostridia bacterium]|nr:AAA family ATPase [Clostridia bacterium]